MHGSQVQLGPTPRVCGSPHRSQQQWTTGQRLVSCLWVGRAHVSLTQSHALIRVGNDYADLLTLGAQQSAILASTQTTTQALGQPQTQAEVTPRQ